MVTMDVTSNTTWIPHDTQTLYTARDAIDAELRRRQNKDRGGEVWDTGYGYTVSSRDPGWETHKLIRQLQRSRRITWK
jgi:hypothetical protein